MSTGDNRGVLWRSRGIPDIQNVVSVWSSDLYTCRYWNIKRYSFKKPFDIPLGYHNSMDLLTFELLPSDIVIHVEKQSQSQRCLSLTEEVLLTLLQTSFLASKILLWFLIDLSTGIVSVFLWALCRFSVPTCSVWLGCQLVNFSPFPMYVSDLFTE